MNRYDRLKEIDYNSKSVQCDLLLRCGWKYPTTNKDDLVRGLNLSCDELKVVCRFLVKESK